MSPELRARAAVQGGVFTRRQAELAGHSEREIKTRTGARGDWVVVRRGAYVERALWETLNEDARHRARVLAVTLVATKDAVVSHTSAAVLHGFPMRPRWRDLLHVTREGVTGGRTEGGVKHHRAAFTEAEVTSIDGLAVMTAARTAVDIGREHGFEDGVVAADAALQRGAERADLERSVARMTCWPGVTRARRAVAHADPGAESIGESLLRLVVVGLRLGRVHTQHHVTDGSLEAWVDLRVGRHLIEFDGKVKYLGRESGGFADKEPWEVVWSEKRREDWIRAQDGGYGMSRVVWEELFGAQRTQLERRLCREHAETCRRYGYTDD